MELTAIQSKIYDIRGVKVMLDFDLAEMYGTETKRLKEAVRRNAKRFEGKDFMFEVTREELSRTQIATLNKGRGYNIKYKPFAFTEHRFGFRRAVQGRSLASIYDAALPPAFSEWECWFFTSHLFFRFVPVPKEKGEQEGDNKGVTGENKPDALPITKQKRFGGRPHGDVGPRTETVYYPLRPQCADGCAYPVGH
jgi:hypothetical protein